MYTDRLFDCFTSVISAVDSKTGHYLMKAWNWPETSCNPTVCACCLCPVCRLLQVFKREITESGWVRQTDVSSGEPVWLQQEPQLSSSSISARLWPRSAAPVIVLLFLAISLLPAPHSIPPPSVPSFLAFHPLLFLWSLCPDFLSFLLPPSHS